MIFFLRKKAFQILHDGNDLYEHPQFNKSINQSFDSIDLDKKKNLLFFIQVFQ